MQIFYRALVLLGTTLLANLSGATPNCEADLIKKTLEREIGVQQSYDVVFRPFYPHDWKVEFAPKGERMVFTKGAQRWVKYTIAIDGTVEMEIARWKNRAYGKGKIFTDKINPGLASHLILHAYHNLLDAEACLRTVRYLMDVSPVLFMNEPSERMLIPRLKFEEADGVNQKRKLKLIDFRPNLNQSAKAK